MNKKPLNNPLPHEKTDSNQLVSAHQAKAARIKLERALSLYFQEDISRAIKALRKALALDPALVNDRVFGNLAHKLTGLPVQEALKSLNNEDASREMIRTAERERKKAKAPPSFRQRFMTVSLIISLAMFLGMCFWALRVRDLDSYLLSIKVMFWETQKHKLDGYEYYALVPSGSSPDGGWPVVVVFHGMGGQAGWMLPIAENFTNSGILFVAPTFGKYHPYPRGPLEPMSRILKKIGGKHPLQTRGAVLLGHSQGGTFAYRFSAYYPEQVAGVVTVGAPDFDAVSPARYDMPYVFTWGEYDWMQEYTLPPASVLQNSGFNVRIYIVPGAGHEMTDFAIDQALSLLVQH